VGIEDRSEKGNQGRPAAPDLRTGKRGRGDTTDEASDLDPVTPNQKRENE
jgi:hypothetical protein